MIIKRRINGEILEFHLTDAELHDAFVEQEHINDLRKVRHYLDENKDEWDFNLTEDMIDEAAWLSREFMDDDDVIESNVWLCIDHAVEETSMNHQEGFK